MSRFKQLKVGDVGLIQQLDDGRIIQLGLTDTQSRILQAFLASLSKDAPFVELSSVTKFTFNKNNNTFEFRAEDWNRDKESIIHTLSKYKHFLIH